VIQGMIGWHCNISYTIELWFKPKKL